MDAAADPREVELAALRAAGDFERAATRTVVLYGPELLGYLLGVVRDETEAREAFSLLCEALWQGLPGFRGECSFRTWAYVLARGALGRVARERSRARRTVELSPEMDKAAASARSLTPRFLKTDVKKRVAAIRAKLDPDDRQLLILRINRGLSWADIARVHLGPDDPDPAALERAQATLRKRFERIKEQVRARAGALDGEKTQPSRPPRK